MSSIPQVASNNTTNPDMSSKRRRFQPPITTYFSPTPTSNSSNSSSVDNASNSNPSFSHHHYSAATSSPMPVVPATVQSSLLSVGMRVRKSVAEGYKTAAALKMDEKNLGISSCYGSSKGIHNVAVEPQPAAPYTSSPLLTKSTTTTQGSVVTDDGDAFSLPSSSQGSSSSELFSIDEQAQAHSRSKRRLDSDLEDEDHDNNGISDDFVRMKQIEMTGDVRNTGIAASSAFGRSILRPNLGQQKRKFFASNGQQRPILKRQGAADFDSDFEEPSFLRRREEVDTEYAAGEGRDVSMDDV